MSTRIKKRCGALGATVTSLVVIAWAQTPAARPQRDAVAEAQQPHGEGKAARAAEKRPRQLRHLRPSKASPHSPVFQTQPKQGKLSGFDFARDPLNADRPNQTPEEIMKKEIANKPNVMAAQRKLLETRYILEPKLDPQAKMSRGSPCLSGRPHGCRAA